MTLTDKPVNGRRIALITPVRDEAAFVGAMIESIMAQELRPAKWVIVDDGSTDSTADIIAAYASQFPEIELLRLPPRRERLPGGESSISAALQRIRLGDFDFLARFDADLIFQSGYMSGIVEKFELDPTLGIAGGGLYVQEKDQLKLERAPEYHVRGALKMYRRRCFEEIGGLTNRIGWDTIDEVSAWARGWRTQNFPGYRVIHRRPTGNGIASRVVWLARGEAEYFTWSHPVFVFTKAIKLLCEKRDVLCPAWFVAGFIRAYWRREARVRDRIFVRTRRRQQWRRMTSMFTGWHSEAERA